MLLRIGLLKGRGDPGRPASELCKRLVVDIVQHGRALGFTDNGVTLYHDLPGLVKWLLGRFLPFGEPEPHTRFIDEFQGVGTHEVHLGLGGIGGSDERYTLPFHRPDTDVTDLQGHRA